MLTWKKYFSCYCLQDFSTKKILKCHVKDCFKINGKQMIKMHKKVNRFKSYDRKIKSTFMIFAVFGSILVPDDR